VLQKFQQARLSCEHHHPFGLKYITSKKIKLLASWLVLSKPALCPAFEFGVWTCGNADKRPDDTVISQFFSGLVCGQECGCGSCDGWTRTAGGKGE